MRETIVTMHRRFKTSRRGWQLYLLLAPALIYVLVFHYGPMYGLQIAFKDFRPKLGIWGSPWVGLKHFERVINYMGLWKMIRNTLCITLYSLALFPFPVVVALLLNEVRSTKYKKTIQMLSYAPHFLSTVVVCGMIMIFTNYSNGLFNNISEALGGQRVDYLAVGPWFSSIYVWSEVWQNLGWSMIIYISALSGVSQDTVEAAIIDGANRMQIIRHVNLPSILPTIAICFILSTGGLLSVGFEKIYLLQNQLNIDYSSVISTYTYQVGLIDAKYSYSSAIGFLNTIINLIFLTISNLVIKRGTGVGVM